MDRRTFGLRMPLHKRAVELGHCHNVGGVVIIIIIPFNNNNNNNNNNNIYLLQLGCHPVAVVILHVNKT